MSSYIGYRVRVFMQNNATFQGTIAFVDNHLIKLRNVQTNDQKRGIVKELLLKAADIKDLEVIGKDEDFRASTDSISPSPNKLSASSDRISQPELTKSSGSIPQQPPQQKEQLLTPDTFQTPPPEVKPAQGVPYQDPAIISIHNSLLQQQQQEQQRQQLNMMLQQTPIANLIRPNMPPMGMPMFPPHFQPPMHMLPINQQPMHGPVVPIFHGPPPPNMGMPPPNMGGQMPPMQVPPVFATNARPPSPPRQEQQQQYEERSNSKSPGRRSTTPNRQGAPFKSPGKNQAAFRKQDRETFSAPISEDIDEDFDFAQSNSRFNKEQVYAELTDDYSRNKGNSNPRAKTPTRVPTISFTTQQGMRVNPVIADVMRQLYQVTQETGPNYYQLAENAGRALAKLALKMTRGKKNPRIVVLIGTSFNASCGLVAARHLANHSVQVSICRSRAYHLPDEVTFLRNVYQNSNGKEAQIGSLPVEPVDLIVDALIGCGLNGAPGGPTATLIGWANANGAPILSCDVPTGVDATTGFAPGDFIRPAATLALGLPKTGLLRDRVGQLYLADIGLVSGTFAKVGIDYQSPFADKFTVPLVIN